MSWIHTATKHLPFLDLGLLPTSVEFWELFFVFFWKKQLKVRIWFMKALQQLPWMYMHEAVEAFNWKSSYVWINPLKNKAGNAVINSYFDQWFNHWPWINIFWLFYSSASHWMIWWGLVNLCVWGESTF